jgi:hypothetical protein
MTAERAKTRLLPFVCGLGLGLIICIIAIRLRWFDIPYVEPPLEVTIIPSTGSRRREQTAASDLATSKSPTPFRNWAELESTNFSSYITKLRAFGCPEVTIRDLIISEINRLYAPKFAELSKPYYLGAFGHMGDAASASRLRESLRLNKEKSSLMKELLGIDAYEEMLQLSGNANTADAQLSFLKAAKREEVLALRQEYSIREQEVYRQARGLGLPEDRVKLEDVHREFQETLARVLAPDELEHYNALTSSETQRMREQLEPVGLSESELLSLYHLRHSPDGSVLDETTRNSKIKELLGETRYAEYLRAQDPEYLGMFALTERFALGADVLHELQGERSQLNDEFLRIKLDGQVSDQDKSRLLTEAAIFAQKRIKELLGVEAFNAYRGSGHLGWSKPPVASQ